MGKGDWKRTWEGKGFGRARGKGKGKVTGMGKGGDE